MSTFESMRCALAPVGVYEITKDSNVYKELLVYSRELDRLYESAEEILREGFFETAESWGLERWERLWGNVRDELSLGLRRRMCTTRASYGFGGFTPEGMAQVLSFLGTEGIIEEYPQVYRIVVDLRQRAYKLPERRWIKAQLNEIFPCHLEVDPVFTGFDWQEADSKALTFKQMDEKNMSWADIDIFGTE